ncbi:MAG TPA: hypothetical protein VGY76_03380 [Solirubrobacteraceae bacterium]|jgi:hypothetical protein|nr:hypothetical protein [Solirubrobacteraceae bacterium]
MVGGWTRKLLGGRPFRLALVPCAILAAVLVAFPGSPALAAAGKPPVIVSMSAGVGGEVTVGAQINPEGLETTYEIRLECRTQAPLWPCEPIPTQQVAGVLAAGDEGREVSLKLTGLQPGSYWFGVLAVNSAGEAFQRSHVLEIPPVPPGACPNGCSNTPPYITTVSPGVMEAEQKWAEGGVAREAARVQAARERAEREAALAKASQPAPVATSSPPPPAPGGVALAAKSITVQRSEVSLVALECLGSASCHGKLTLLAKAPVKTKGTKGRRLRAHSVAIGAASFSITGYEAKTVKVPIDALGRALLKADHGRLRASLAIHELAPSPENTVTEAVLLLVKPRS